MRQIAIDPIIAGGLDGLRPDTSAAQIPTKPLRPRATSPLCDRAPASGSGRRHVPGTPGLCARLDFAPANELPPANAQRSGGRAPAGRGPGGRESGAFRSRPPGKPWDAHRKRWHRHERWSYRRAPPSRALYSASHCSSKQREQAGPGVSERGVPRRALNKGR